MRVKNPLQYAAGYTLDLYCDQNLKPWEHNYEVSIYAQTFSQCAKEARRRGWKIHKDDTATCPHCNKKKKSTK